MVKAYFEKIRQQILSELDNAKQSVVVAVYWFTNETLFEKLITKVNEGVKVELIIHNDYINNRETGLRFQEFINKGANFYFSDTSNPMHNKFCVIDDKVLINGSYNWTYYAEDRNRENILLIKEEEETINAFLEEFERLKSLTEKVERVRPLTRFEVDENNLLRARDYLANNIIYQAKATGRRNIVESAFQIAPENIEVQKVAASLNLTKKYRLKFSIGSSLLNDGYNIIIKKGSQVPESFSHVVVTTADNQPNSNATIHFGENPKASENPQLRELILTGLPPKSAGEAKMKYNFIIDYSGNMRMEKFSLDNGVRISDSINIAHLLEEVI